MATIPAQKLGDQEFKLAWATQNKKGWGGRRKERMLTGVYSNIIQNRQSDGHNLNVH